jgi:hypothetical protein
MVVKFGRWKTRSGGVLLSDYISAEDLEDLIDVAVQTHEYFAHHDRKGRGRKV